MPSTGTPESKINCGARGEPASCTDSGPAGEDPAFPPHLTKSRFRLLERHDFGIDALLAHPARDQLRDLAAEIDDQNLVMRRGHLGALLAGWLCCCHGKQIRDARQGRNPKKAVMAGLVPAIHGLFWGYNGRKDVDVAI